jgi:hypothetical protein
MDIYSILEQYGKLSKFHTQYFNDNPDIDWPNCSCGCGLPVLLNSSEPNKVFRQYASSTCSRKSKTISKTAEHLLQDKDWLYNQRFVLLKSKELIGKELGVSITPINKWLKFHGINNLRLNESEHTIQNILNNKELLETDYSSGKTLEELSKIYGTTKSTLSIFFKKHNLVTRDSNSYERKNPRSSKEEQEVYNWIRSIISSDIEMKSNNRTLLGSELDILIPELKIAIEYNGIYSHIYRPHETTPAKIKGPLYHLGKTLKCNDVGINLIHIFSSQWNNNREAVETYLMSKLKVNRRIFGRQCSVRLISPYDKNQFLNRYHLQGADKSKYHYGLYYKEELVSVMTFAKPRYNKEYDWELVRFSGTKGITVVGGFSKLLSAFRKDHEGSIISYADRTYSNGDVYSKNGFNLKKINRPGFRYVNLNTGTIKHRSMYTKKRLLQMLNITDTTKSESELAADLGLQKIFDCGTLTYVLEKLNG